MPALTEVLGRGLAAERPTAALANQGWYYYATDTTTLSQSDGTTWHTLSVGGGGTDLSTFLISDGGCFILAPDGSFITR